MNKSIKVSLILNIIIVILVILGTIFMITNFQFMMNSKILTNEGWLAFKYYTVDSNILIGISSLILVIYELLLIKHKLKKIPNYVYIFKMIATTSVTLTMLITLFYLAPYFGNKFYELYINSNLLFHLIIPILAIISFTIFEKTKIDYKHTFLSVSFTLIYGIFYIINILTHLKNGKIVKEYDWYGFTNNGDNPIALVFLLILIITYLISLILWKFNYKRGNNYE